MYSTYLQSSESRACGNTHWVILVGRRRRGGRGAGAGGVASRTTLLLHPIGIEAVLSNVPHVTALAILLQEKKQNQAPSALTLCDRLSTSWACPHTCRVMIVALGGRPRSKSSTPMTLLAMLPKQANFTYQPGLQQSQRHNSVQ